MDFSRLLPELVDGRHLLTQVPYALLVLSMLMADIGWLRAVAILAGVARIIDRTYFTPDPVVVMWEGLFIAVNLSQLLILLYYRKRHRFSEDEHKLIEHIPDDVERHAIRRLLRLAKLGHAAPGELLTEEGKPVTDLIFIAHGVAQVERGGQIIAVCGPGEFIGEMSFVTGAPASATVVAARPMRYFRFDQQKLQAAKASDRELRRALEASLSRNLAKKLTRVAPVTGTSA